ncbi:MAG: hypothetical protein LBO71_10875 [Prevotellaceae bacterium]|jgi:hypothetical protein|nr:hypothetical protein [Prevotellaceae bacterium]
MKKMFLPVVMLAVVAGAFVSSCEEPKKLLREEVVADFMFQYTNLTPQQVTDIAGAESLAFSNSEKSPGYTLKLDDSTSLIVPEGTACMRLNDITLNVWRKDSSTLTFFVAVVDERTQLATVFEAWLCGENFFNQTLPPRELQRHITTGFIAGSDVSGHRHKATKRLTGKVIQWSDELTLFGSHSYSASVPKGSLQTFCYPADYYELDSRHWLYSRVEVEFSGEFVLDVIDLYALKKIGVRLGFDAQDKFIAHLYSDAGAIRGQVAAFGPFSVSNQKMLSTAPEFMRVPVELPVTKGMRFLYRPLDLTKPMTLEEVKEVALNTKAWKGAFETPGKEKKMLEHSTLLENRIFTLTFDDKTAWEYEIGKDFTMRFREGAGEWKSERYDAFEMDDQLVFFAHATDGDCPIDGLQYAIDLKNGLVTCIRSTFDDEANPRVPRQQWLFGVINADGITPSKRRHQFTDELLGHSYTWEYGDELASQHYYTSTESFSFAIFQNSEVGVMGSFPCKYVKIRDGVYLMSWIEMRSQGIQGILLFNTKTMHDCGTCHGMTHDQTFEFNTFCAEARSAGQYN